MMRSFFSLTSLRRIIIITMDVVRLSRMAERMNVMKAIRHSRERLLLVFSVSLTKLKPPFWSTNSTMVMAPIRKNSVVPVSPRCSSIILLTAPAICSCSTPARLATSPAGSIMKRVQQTTNISRAIAALLILVTLSIAIKK